MTGPLVASLRDGQNRDVAQLVGRDNTVEVKQPARPGVRYFASVAGVAEAVESETKAGPLRPAIRDTTPAFTRGQGLVLLYLASRWQQTHRIASAAQCHITLAYALPLALDPAWRGWAEAHLDLLVAGRQLVAVPASDLVAVDATRADPRQHRRLLRRHTATTVDEHHDVEGFLDDWSRFTAWRYQRCPPPQERAALRAMLSLDGVAVRDFVHEGSRIARAIVCAHERHRVLFDLMATWRPEHARLRPGIYSGLWNLLDAKHRGMRFSFCYGQFAYKDDIVGSAPRLTFADLAGSEHEQLIQLGDRAAVSGQPVQHHA